MKAVYLNEAEGAPLQGSTKLYGNPDVPEDFEWPCIIDEDDIYDLSFMGQLNLRDLAALYPDSPLPCDGMLYFFYDLDAMAFSPFDETAARVVLIRGDEPLDELCLEDEDGNALCNPAVKLALTRSDDESAENGGGHKLFGIPVGYSKAEYPRPIEGWVMLMQIASTKDVEFEEGGTLCFFMEADKLAKADFSDVRVMIVARE